MMKRRDPIPNLARQAATAHAANAAAGLEVRFAQASDCGRVRPHNEDCLGHVVPANAAQARSHGWLFVLADGVGGHRHGEVASRIAVETMVAGFHQSAAGEPHGEVLTRLVQAANARVYESSTAAGYDGAGMATTIVACALRYDRATIAHVGDSRCYLVRSGRLRALTRDHTVTNEQIRLGVLSGDEAAEAATRHLLSRSVGSDLFVNVDTAELHLVVGDVLLLCSDGLHAAVPEEKIAQLVAHHDDLHAAARELIETANDLDGSDNVSVQLLRIGSVERVGMYRGRPYKLH